MNLERGFSVPVEKRDFWAPVTPEKPVEQRPEQNQNGGEDWQDLLGLYTGLLQDQICEPIVHGFAPAAAATFNGVPQTCDKMLPHSCGSDGLVGVNQQTRCMQDVAPVDNLDQNGGNACSFLQDVGDLAPPRKVNSLEELLGIRNTLNSPATNGERITSGVKKATSTSQHSQVERSWNNCIQNQDTGAYNLQQMPTSRLSVACRPNYNLNSPQRSEDGESSSVTRPFHLGPETPDQHTLLKTNQISPVPHPSIEEIATKEDSNKANFTLPRDAGIGEKEHNGFVSDTQSTASPDTSTTKEKQNLGGANDKESVQSETPPQKTPKRRKHRPKVVVEGKPRRTPKAAAKESKSPSGDPPKKRKYVRRKGEESKSPSGDPPKKRKYVRRKGINTPTNQSVDAESEAAVPNSRSKGKSCKRALNFDLENGAGKKSKCREFDHQEDNNKGSEASISPDLDFHNTGLNEQGTCTEKAVHQNICSEEKQSEQKYNDVPFVDKIPPQESSPPAATTPPTASKGRTLNAIARSLNAQSASINLSVLQGNYGQEHHSTREGFCPLIIQANANQQNLDGLTQPRLQSMPQLLEDLVGNRDKHEPRREYSNDEPRRPQASQKYTNGVSGTGHFKKESTRPWLAESSSSSVKNAEEISALTNQNYAQTCIVDINGKLSYFGIEEISALTNQTYEINKVTPQWCMNSINSGVGFQKQMGDIASHPFAEALTNSSLTAVRDCHRPSTSPKDPNIIKPACMPAKRRYTRKTSSNQMSSTTSVVQKESRNIQCSGYELVIVSGSREHKRNLFMVDHITYRLKHLRISNNDIGRTKEEQNALVPYKGDGAVVPHEAFEPVKKRRPRPQVDLDPETNRLWNLLMGSEGSESAETMDEDKQKRWEEDRRVFRGRVDSFIARMHLVQGDRRFSKWKGSVVDSVIGVYLTQNVTDHLSSSAFMSLAAKFPVKTTNIRDTSCQKTGNQSAEYEVLVSHPDGTTSHQQMTREPLYDHKVPPPTFSVNQHTRRTEEQIVSSQSSSEPASFQASEDIRSSSGSNLEVDDQVTGSNSGETCGHSYLLKKTAGITASPKDQIQDSGFSFPDKRSSNDHQEYENLTSITNACSYPLTTNLQHHQRPAATSKSTWQDMLMGTGDEETDVFAFLEKEYTSSLASTLCDTTSRTVIEDLHDKVGQSMESRPMEQQNQSFEFQESYVIHTVPKEHLEKTMNIASESESRNYQQSINSKLNGVEESTFQTDPTDNQKHCENITHDPTEMKTPHAPDEQSSKSSTSSPSRKQKAEKEKRESFDWDSLRKQVKLKGGARERSKDKMDSLDYEALRNADVREISDIIKERGMNNMLAARIKDFLDRLVKDHGSIDLEWLRDVQPDKVKDYLLSIRGLGLKSVECIRLLTLHHLAFPVDTNVGRIAVRLGWVPLRPLPESLQLHLLELYPVLESIQKYLWPRLCMLDQETLYELHYQLITFGKVFCTKRQPNCNACPMRGECRHFASAFASARLALPGPEERRVVCSDVAMSSQENIGIVTKPMSLPPSENDIGNAPGFTRNCEPIIEEPATPEPSIEVTERDIEDSFYEDPDEIPEIKLNIEEFTTNLKRFIQENNEIQEGDMSKAIISSSPQFASLPTPKLKHVSRLRTEHQVYELPDSHPLLEGMDRREPDDPSPYVLALWTPGETADTIQLPEGKCSSSEGGMCDNNTCFTCNSKREAHAQTVRGTILIPCRTAMRGSFPLNGTYFQVNEVFADDETSKNPINVPRSLIWNLPRRTVFFGTSVSTIFKGMSTEGIQYCFWRGFICVRGFDQKTRAPRPLKARLHLPASKIPKKND